MMVAVTSHVMQIAMTCFACEHFLLHNTYTCFIQCTQRLMMAGKNGQNLQECYIQERCYAGWQMFVIWLLSTCIMGRCSLNLRRKTCSQYQDASVCLYQLNIHKDYKITSSMEELTGRLSLLTCNFNVLLPNITHSRCLGVGFKIPAWFKSITNNLHSNDDHLNYCLFRSASGLLIPA